MPKAGPRSWASLIPAALLLLPVRYAVERWKPFQHFEAERAVARALRALPEGRVLVVGAGHPIEAMFYGDRAAYAEVPAEGTLSRLRAAGWQIVQGAP